MSLFGKLDAANIPTNPFFIEKGDYSAEVTKAQYKTNRDQQKQLVIEYTITDEESQFLDSRASKYYTLVDSEMTQEMFELMPADEKKKIRQAMAALKRDLCGNDNNPSQKGLGISMDDLNDDFNPEILVGTKVQIGISNYGANNEGVNIRWVNLAE